jgi:hypothetical protein
MSLLCFTLKRFERSEAVEPETIGTAGTGFGITSTTHAIRQLMTPPEPNKRKIGFLVKESAPRYGRA